MLLRSLVSANLRHLGVETVTRHEKTFGQIYRTGLSSHLKDYEGYCQLDLSVL